MKTFFMLLFTVSALFTGINEDQETATMTAKYLGTQDGQFYFAEGDKEAVAFHKVDSKVSQAINLTDDKLKGQTFEVTYTTSEAKDENSGEAVKVLTIVGIKPVKG